MRFYFILHNPSGPNREEHVDAKNKTEARKIIAADYRENTPPASAGFYTFGQCSIEWTRQEESTPSDAWLDHHPG